MALSTGMMTHRKTEWWLSGIGQVSQTTQDYSPWELIHYKIIFNYLQQCMFCHYNVNNIQQKFIMQSK